MVPYITITELRTNPYYSTYYINLAVLFVLGVIPVSLLAYFNCVIYLKIKPPTILLHAEDCVGGSTSRISSCTNHEKDLARVLIGIVIMFILCHILRLIINFYETIEKKSFEVFYIDRCYAYFSLSVNKNRIFR